jgi:hypothetical protein
VATAAVLVTLTPAAGQPPAGPVDAKYVPPSFFAALVIDPVRFDRAAAAAGVPVDDLWQVIDMFAGVDAKALDARKLDRLTILIDPFPAGNLAFMTAVAARFPAGTDARKKLAPVLGGDVTEAKAGDTAYSKSTKFKMAKVEMAGYAADDRTLLISAWPDLEAMLKPGGADRPLGAALAKVDLDHEVVLVATPAPLLKRLAEKEKEAGGKQKEPFFEALRPALEKLEVATVALDLGRDTLLRAEFRAADAAGAGVVHDTLKDLLGKAKQAYPEARKEIASGLPADRAAPLLAFLDAVVNTHTLTKDGRTVVLTVARPKELAPKK